MTTLVDADPLLYLPWKRAQDYAKGQIIYAPHQQSDSLYVVVRGRVKITTSTDGGAETVGRIVTTDGLFGESVLAGRARGTETAVALDALDLMSWTCDEIEQQIQREPRLGIALAQHLVRRCIELQNRIENMAVLKTPERVMLALVQLADSLGTPMPDGSIRIEAITQSVLADYVGTSREIVTHEMNRLRRLGMLEYSRKNIDIHTAAIAAALHPKQSLDSG